MSHNETTPRLADALFRVRGQTVVVSGGTRGIGRALSHGFAAHGARVVLTGREAESAQRCAAEVAEACDDAEVIGMQCDVSNNDAIRAFVARLSDAFADIDTLVNVAGVNRRKPAAEVTDDDYDHVMNTNLRGAFELSRAIGAGMRNRGHGSLIQIASLATMRPLTNMAPYAMSKSALGAMTRSLAMEWGPSGVRVNALAPGFVVTDLTRPLWSDQGMRDWAIPQTPLRRLGTPEDMVGTALFLASPASAFLTGQLLCVDGGFSCGWNWPIPG